MNLKTKLYFHTATYEEGAEEDEGDKIGNGNIEPALRFCPVGGGGVTHPPAHTRQHNLLPVLSGRTSGEKTRNNNMKYSP